MVGILMSERKISLAKQVAQRFAGFDLFAMSNLRSKTTGIEGEAAEARLRHKDCNMITSSTWFDFCTERKNYYEYKGEITASLFYHTMRSFVITEANPCTEEGYTELSEFWNMRCDYLGKNLK
jgi:hypothetical protein